MTEISVDDRALLAQLIDQCSDAMLARLADEAARLPADRAQALADTLRNGETDRRRRERAFAPLLPLFRPRADGMEALTFPAAILPRLWRMAAAREFERLHLLDSAHGWAVMADRLCHAAAAAIRDRPDDVWPEETWPEGVGPEGVGPEETGNGDAQTEQARLEQARPDAGRLEALAVCLDLTPLLRELNGQMETWLLRPDAAAAARLRLLVRDAAAVSPEGPGRLLDILLAHLEAPALITRIINLGWSGPGCSSLPGAEDVDRLVRSLGARLDAGAARIAALTSGSGGDAIGRTWDVAALMAEFHSCGAVLAEMDMNLPATGDAWAAGVVGARQTLSRRADALLARIEQTVQQALPVSPMRLVGRMTRPAPLLTASPDSEAMEAALNLVRLVPGLRGPSTALGFEAARAALSAQLGGALSQYADEALIAVNTGEATDEANALALIGRAAELLVRLDAPEDARAVRRRLAVAGTPSSDIRAAR